MKGVDQRINGGQAVFFSDIGKMSVTRGCYGAGMAEKRLDMPKA